MFNLIDCVRSECLSGFAQSQFSSWFEVVPFIWNQQNHNMQITFIEWYDMQMTVWHAQCWFRGELIGLTSILLLWLIGMCTVCSLWCVGSCRLTYIDCHTSLLYALDVVSRLCLCVSYNVDIHVLWFWRCVYYVLCVESSKVSAYNLCVHIKNTSQSLCNIYFHDRSIFTFHTSLCSVYLVGQSLNSHNMLILLITRHTVYSPSIYGCWTPITRHHR